MPMTNGRLRASVFVCTLLVCLGALFATTSCSTNESKAKKVIQEYMKNQGTKDLTMDSFFVDPNNPGKAYASATVTYNFASSGGNPQREFLGFILAQEGDGWRIERSAGYTKDQQQATKYLAGGK